MNTPFIKQAGSWLNIEASSDFSIYNIPFGIARLDDGYTGAFTRLGDNVLNLQALLENGYFEPTGLNLQGKFNKPSLNEFISMGKIATAKVRERIQHLVQAGNSEIVDYKEFTQLYFIPVSKVQMLMPLKVNNYTDFYSSIEHASNVGSMFRDPSNPLLPNWRHLPVAYHGRASSIVVSSTSIHRPKGQIAPPEGSNDPLFSATRMLDFELEVAFVVGKSTELGDSVPANEAEEYIFGFLLFNDLSARDIQAWEYIPLGPFLSKNFGSIVSPWVVTLEALEPFKVKGPEQMPPVLAYLETEGPHNYDIKLEVSIKPSPLSETKVCATNFKYMYWNVCQQLAHHTINGCNISVGDLYASGTISGTKPDSRGSLLELTWRGKHPLTLNDGSERTFIEDDDTIIMRGFASKDEMRVGFGECITTILPVK